MQISLEEIISLVVNEVLAELNRRQIKVEGDSDNIFSTDDSNKKNIMDLSEYKTPLLTELHILELDSEVGEIQVPIKTIITPSAHDLIRKRKIIITKK